MSDQKSDMIKIGGLWLNESQSGNKYFSGSLGSARIMIFKNGYKETEKHPDYIMYLTANNRSEQGDGDFENAKRATEERYNQVHDRSKWHMPTTSASAPPAGSSGSAPSTTSASAPPAGSSGSAPPAESRPADDDIPF